MQKIIILITFIILLITIYNIYLIINKPYKILYNINKLYNKYDLSNNQTYFCTNESYFKQLRDNYEIIYNEYIDYIKNNELKRYNYIFEKLNDDLDLDKQHTWKLLVLRNYNIDTNKIKYFPKQWSL
jgi:hypothetical protein